MPIEIAVREARVRDRIDCTAVDVDALNQRFAGADASAILRAVIADGVVGKVALVSSFGTESAVLLDLVATVDRATLVLFLDTGKHFAETLAYRETLVAALGLTNVRVITPDAQAIRASDATGLRWSYDPDGCCALRKVAPLDHAMRGLDASITGRKAFQASTRSTLPIFERDGNRIKVNPLIQWSKADIDAHFTARDLPRHPLEAQGYASIGCAPCTSRIKPGEDPRAGRWRGWDKTECGIHSGDAPDPLPPGYEPAF